MATMAARIMRVRFLFHGLAISRHCVGILRNLPIISPCSAHYLPILSPLSSKSSASITQRSQGIFATTLVLFQECVSGLLHDHVFHRSMIPPLSPHYLPIIFTSSPHCVGFFSLLSPHYLPMFCIASRVRFHPRNLTFATGPEADIAYTLARCSIEKT